MPIVYLALGSNLNMPRRQLIRAFKYLRALPRTGLHRRSHIYLTKPMGVRAQPNYFNMVVTIRTQLSPDTLLLNCKNIEQKQRRVRKKIWGSRSIDIDILLYGQICVKKLLLTIPHPHLLKRDFVIVPMLELSPQQCLPGGEKVKLSPGIGQTIIRTCV